MAPVSSHTQKPQLPLQCWSPEPPSPGVPHPLVAKSKSHSASSMLPELPHGGGSDGGTGGGLGGSSGAQSHPCATFLGARYHALAFA